MSEEEKGARDAAAKSLRLAAEAIEQERDEEVEPHLQMALAQQTWIAVAVYLAIGVVVAAIAARFRPGSEEMFMLGAMALMWLPMGFICGVLLVLGWVVSLLAGSA